MSLYARREFLARVGRGVFGAMAGAGLSGAAGRAMVQAASGPSAHVAAAADATKPNIVFILADDMGWMDTSVYGSTFYETPNIDRLASEGMRFTQAYAACPVCSPTRASILTGKYPARLHVTDWIPGKAMPYAKLKVPAWTQHLPPEETTIAEALKAAGYTTGCFGKWHLGTKPEWSPEAQGFDVVNVLPTHKDGDPKVVGEITRSALDFIEQSKDKPFFAYIAHHAVHLPVESPPEFVPKFEAKRKPGQAQNNANYAGMVANLDRAVGQVLERIAELGLAQRTIVIFMSDNGGYSYGRQGDDPITSNAPLRLGKGTLYEGGVREPFIVRWPGVIQAGALCDTPVISVDFYPTLLELAGAPDLPGHVGDGLSIAPLLKQTGAIQREALYWHYPHYHMTTPGGVVRAGDYKLIEYYEDGRVELYDLKNDLSETTDLAAKLPEKAKELRAKLDDWRKSVDAQMPTPNPNHDPARATQGGRATKTKKKAAKANNAEGGSDKE